MARPYIQRLGVCCTVLFLIMGITSVFVAATNLGGSFKEPIMTACLFGCIWGLFTLLGIYIWVVSRKYKLEITDDVIEQSGVFTQRRIAIRDIRDAKWRIWPEGGSIKLKTANSQMSIELGITDSRESLIQFLHSAIPVSKQSGWDTFLHHEEKSKSNSSLSPFWLGVIFNGFAALFVAAWLMGLGVENLVAAVITCGGATYLMTRKFAG